MLEHHERMDGSGYPRGLPGAEISPMGRILLLAEVVTAFYEKYTDMPAQRLSLVLRLNHRKFPAALVAHVLPLLQEDVARDSALMPWAPTRRCKSIPWRAPLSNGSSSRRHCPPPPGKSRAVCSPLPISGCRHCKRR